MHYRRHFSARTNKATKKPMVRSSQLLRTQRTASGKCGNFQPLRGHLRSDKRATRRAVIERCNLKKSPRPPLPSLPGSEIWLSTEPGKRFFEKEVLALFGVKHLQDRKLMQLLLEAARHLLQRYLLHDLLILVLVEFDRVGTDQAQQESTLHLGSTLWETSENRNKSPRRWNRLSRRFFGRMGNASHAR